MNTPSQQALTPEQCEQFRNISEALPTLWGSNQITHTHQKELLRALIARVNLKRVVPGQIEVNIIWVSGHYTLLHAAVPIHRNEEVTGMSTVLQRIHELCEQDIADEQMLNSSHKRDSVQRDRQQYPNNSSLRPDSRIVGLDRVKRCTERED